MGICVNPVNVADAKKYLNNTNVKIVTVVGFPLGASRSDVKAFETQKAIEDGADEVDMVLNVSKMKDKDYEFIKKDIETVIYHTHTTESYTQSNDYRYEASGVYRTLNTNANMIRIGEEMKKNLQKEWKLLFHQYHQKYISYLN